MKGCDFLVKGVSKRVVVVQSPDKRVFEEAIFIVREECCNDKSMSGDMIIREAQEIANRYIRENLKKRMLPKMPPLFYLSAGAIITGAVWIATLLLF